MVAPTWVIPGGTNKLLYDTGSGLAEAAVGQGLSLSGGTLGSVGTLQAFGTVGEASSALIPTSAQTITIAGFNTSNDSGGGIYAKVASLPSFYVGLGTVTGAVPPGFASGGVPNLVFSTTWWNHQIGGTSVRPIIANSLTFIIMIDPGAAFPSTVTDSAGNVYTKIIDASTATPGTHPAIGMYYCAAPVYAPIGTKFNVPGTNTCVDVYCVPGFVGAVPDQSVSQVAASNTGPTLSTAALSATPQLVIGAVNVGSNPILTADPPFQYTPPSGWANIAPPKNGRNPISVTVVNSVNAVTYHPTWTSSVPTVTLLVTFKGSPQPYNRTVFDPSYWALQPTWPVHTAQYGISPDATDNADSFVNFTTYLASVAPPSSTSDGKDVQASRTVAISNGSPAVVTVTPTANEQANGIQFEGSNGQWISFYTSPGGSLPAPLVAGVRYAIQHGTIVAAGASTFAMSFNISETSIFNSQNQYQKTSPKGAPIATTSAGSGTFYYQTYGDSWVEFVLDPGVYTFSNSLSIGIGNGLKKVRMIAYGARFHSATNVGSFSWYDVNSSVNASFPEQPYVARFNSSDMSSGIWPSFIQLSTIADATNFWVNSWIYLSCNEMQTSVTGNWNQFTFEYVKIKSVNTTTGVISFYDKLQYNYNANAPLLVAPNGAWSGAITGPAMAVQLGDGFNTELEVYGATYTGIMQENFSGVVSIRLVDCEVFGLGYKTGPTPTTIRKFTAERCRFHNMITEVDKALDTVQYVECDFDTSSRLVFQSASINKCLIDRCRMHDITGTPKDFTLRDSVVAGLEIAPVYGVTERMLLLNSNIQSITFAAQEGSLVVTTSQVTFSNGTIKTPSGGALGWSVTSSSSVNPINPFLWGIPGGKAMLAVPSNVAVNGIGAFNGSVHAYDAFGMMAAFAVLDVYVDGSNNYCVDTTLAALPTVAVQFNGSVAGTTALTVTSFVSTVPASFTPLLMSNMTVTGPGITGSATISVDIGAPNTTAGVGTYTLAAAAGAGSGVYTATFPIRFFCHPCPRLTVLECTGGRFVTDMAGAPPDIPVYSYFRRGFAGNSINTFIYPAYVNLTGRLQSWQINVVKPFTGTGAYNCSIGMLGYYTTGTTIVPVWITQVIDLKTAGVRTITSATTSPLGTDTLVAVPSSVWLSGGHLVVFGTASSGTLDQWPYIIMTGQTTHGIESPNMTVRPVSGVIDEFADTVMQATIN